jgi:hypothetical protein
MPDSAYPSGAGASPEDVSRGLTRIRGLREGAERDFDVAVLDEREQPDPAGYEQAGATWWLNGVNDRRGSPDEMLALVNEGPPS